MPSTLLFANNNEGRVYALSTGSSAWREFLYLGLEFKKVSAVPHFMWSIGGDRQVYVHVHGLDIPIRVKEEAYENERWLPLEGFSSRLLPTDRYNFSSIDGTTNRAIDRIRLPSMAWQWEGDWHLDCTHDGQPLDHDAWTYAIDFPAKFQVKKAWNSCVRRRKWVRFRRYSAMNSWCAVAPLHKDPTQEPFIDVAIGGNNVPGAAPGMLLVWAITAHGRVMIRSGVSTTSPEGLRWTAISTPSGAEVSQISVGPTGLVWASLYCGRAIVRSGVTKDSPTGESWLEIKPPGNALKIVQVSVGTNAVWCVTNDNHVWFRRGVKGETAGISEDSAIGSGWVEMVGNISSVSVAANDQVFAVGSEDRALYFRSGVSASDLTGKKWRLIQCPMQLSRTSSMASLASRRSGSGSPGSRHRSLSSLLRGQHQAGSMVLSEENEETSRSAPTVNARHKPELWQKPAADSPPSASGSLTASSLNACSLAAGDSRKHDEEALCEKLQNVAASAPVQEIFEISGKHFETPLRNPRAWSPVRSVGSMVGTEAHPESDSVVFDAETSRDSGVFGEEDDHGGSQYWAECDVIWTGCSAGAVLVDPQQLPNWFNDTLSAGTQAELSQPWRLRILEDLKGRLSDADPAELEKYQLAIEMSSWVKSGEARVAKSHGTFEDCLIELEWVNASGSSGLDSGTLTILNPDGVTTKMQFPLSEITCVMCQSEPGCPRLTIHTPRLPLGSSLIRLQFSGDTDMEDWLSHLTSVCCQINEVHGRPSNDSVWITTNLGDVFVFDPSTLKAQQYKEDKRMYVQEIDLSATETPYHVPLPNGLTPGTELEISGCVYDDADHIRFDLQCHPTVKVRHKVESQRHVLMHLNPRFNEKEIILNSMENSQWMTEIRDSRMVFSQGGEFKLNIRCEKMGYRIAVDDRDFLLFKHRAPPEAVSSLFVSGRIKLFGVVYHSMSTIVPLRDIFWRQMGGHLRRVESCGGGVTWGIGYDGTAWVYTGGWGGAFLKGLETSTTGINGMSDTHKYYIYENQRWNPLSGYTSTGLPTDRHMWSDATGKHKRSKEHTKLLSMHWQWISDWLVDFSTPGGVDREGWQYAVDFPASYHGKKQFTDYVRRRRWYRKCRLTASGPWHEVGNAKIIDVALQPMISSNGDDANASIDAIICVWAVAPNGDALYRHGVSQSNPAGSSWEHVASEQPLVSITCTPEGKVWAIGRNGSAFYRYGVTREKLLGESWQVVEPPQGGCLKQIRAGDAGVWVLDATGRLAVRREITVTFPEGSHWQVLNNVPNDPPHSEGANVGFRSVSVGAQVWAVSNTGFVCRRCGVTPENPAGTGWNLGILGNFQHISVNGFS
ncbi:tectonin beta-propeller repeat-containing protein isoform X2 [Lutzomyia longipalpis]|uniref:tectonin beta-propeller repeat-containing protein isoform X2 n=1 Tax=Lutzomyia longipalpis TaxID=7200 RepID=UPI002484153F|nr:tectonin beta-propeller repeat-containing protein isoform X2 [Lutzomyia longipalpis]